MKTTPVALMFHAVCAGGILRAAAALILLLAGAPLAVCAASSPPDQMSYQGFLVDGDGNPLAPSTPQNYQVVFRIYDEQEGGAPLWTEQQTVTVDNGNFSVVLGEGTQVPGETHGALSQVFLGSTASQRYMGLTVTIGANSLTLLPRLRLLPAPYSFLASQAAQLVDPATGSPFVSLSGTSTAIPGDAHFGGTILWGTGARLTGDNGGSIEVGDSTSAGLMPYLDFHYGTGAAQDWNMRLINDGDGRLSIHGGRLSFGNSLANTKLALWESGGPAYGLGIQSSQFRFHVDTPAGRFSFLNAPDGTEVMSIHGDGRVGIGTGSAVPAARLEVKGWVNANRTFTYYAKGPRTVVGFNGSFPIGNMGGASGTVDYSILAERRIGATEFNAFSDARIKNVVGVSDSQKDLEMIRRLRVKDYYFVDRIGDGDGLKKGFIAQEVKALIPEAVSTSRRFVPDIYALPQTFEYDSGSHRLTVTLDKAHELKEGGRVQIFADEKRLELEVAKVLSPKKFVLKKCESKPSQVFVFGKEVSDFMILNYDHIFTTGISAIQELNRIVEAKDARIASLEREMAGLKKQMAANLESSGQWQARFAALEKLMAGVVAERVEVKPTTVAVREDR